MIFRCQTNPKIHRSPAMQNVQDKTQNLLFELLKEQSNFTIFGSFRVQFFLTTCVFTCNSFKIQFLAHFLETFLTSWPFYLRDTVIYGVCMYFVGYNKNLKKYMCMYLYFFQNPILSPFFRNLPDIMAILPLRYCKSFMGSACTLEGRIKKNKKVHCQVGKHKKETCLGILDICILYVRP